MSGHPFQIPGLGQARPNEQLPADNFAPDLLVAAASIVGQDVLAVSSADPAQLLQQLQKPKAEEKTEEKKDENVMEIDSKQSDSAPTKTQEDVSMANHGDNKQQAATDNPTASSLDSPPSPDVTSTLEAALNGMLNAPTSSATVANGEVQDGAQYAQEEEHPEWEEDSSPYESSSESSSDSSSDDDSDDEDAHPILGVEETVRMLMAGLDDEEEDGPNKGKGAGAPLRTKNEIVEEVIPKPEVVITPEMTIEPLAHVEFIVENTVVMKSRVPGEVKVLDLGSVLCKEDRTVIGALAEIIGNVKSPMYTCVFQNQEEIKQLGLEVGTHIFYSVDHANYVFTQELKKQKGTDASNLHDEEVGADEMEFSDDEKEAEYKKQLKMKKRGGKAGRGGLREQVLRDQSYAPNAGYAPSAASSATLDHTSTTSNATLNYDEDDDGPYRPLARPVGFGQGGPPSLPPKPEVGFNAAHGGQSQRGGFSRGNRGEFRGRGQRGGNRGADRKPGGHRGGRGGAAAPSYGGYESASAPQFPNTQLPPPIPQNAQIPPPPFGGATPPMPGGHWPHIPIPFPPPPMSFPRPSTQSPVPPPQLAGAFNFNFQAWNQAQGQQYPYPQQASSSSAPAPQQQSSTPSYPHQAPAVPPVWPGVPPPPPVAGAYVNPAFFQQLQAQAQHAQPVQQAQQPQQPQQTQQPQQQQQYWGQHNAYGQAPK